MKQLLAVDWGTSSLRGALMNADGKVLKERSFARGILTVEAGGFPQVFESCFGDWMNPGNLCLMSGMVGSKQGWREAAYCPCPASFHDIANALEWIEPGRIAIVPGLCVESQGIPDVMRGEETQIFGALELLGLASARVVLPGTHSKWVTVTDRRVMDFSTWMTGEFYALLRQHSILARTLPTHEHAQHSDALDDAAGHAFDQGVTHALHGQGLLHTAFSVRTLSLFNRMDAQLLPSYLSGLLIGEELKAQTLSKHDVVVLMGAEGLTARYERALSHLGARAQRLGNTATWHGLHVIAQTLPAL